MSFYWDSEGSPVGSILRGVYWPSLWGITILPVTSACMCVWAFVALLIFWPLVLHVLYTPTDVCWACRITPETGKGVRSYLLLPALSAEFNRRPLGFRRPLRMPPGALLFCWSEAETPGSPMAWPGLSSELVLRWGWELAPWALRLLGSALLSLSLTFRCSHLFAINACLLSWPRLELEYLLGCALLYFFDAPL